MYHGRKVKAMLDKDTIMGIMLEPLRLQKGFLQEQLYCLVCFKGLNNLSSKVLSRTQEAARSHSDLPVLERQVYNSGRSVFCSIWEGEINYRVTFKIGTDIKSFSRCTVWSHSTQHYAIGDLRDRWHIWPLKSPQFQLPCITDSLLH